MNEGPTGLHVQLLLVLAMLFLAPFINIVFSDRKHADELILEKHSVNNSPVLQFSAPPAIGSGEEKIALHHGKCQQTKYRTIPKDT